MGKVLPPLVLGGEYLVGEPRGDRSTEGRNHHGPRGACSDEAAEPRVSGRGGDAPLEHAGQQPVARQRRRRVGLPATRCHHRLQAVKAARACAEDKAGWGYAISAWWGPYLRVGRGWPRLEAAPCLT